MSVQTHLTAFPLIFNLFTLPIQNQNWLSEWTRVAIGSVMRSTSELGSFVGVLYVVLELSADCTLSKGRAWPPLARPCKGQGWARFLVPWPGPHGVKGQGI